MDNSIWLTALAGAALLVYFVLRRTRRLRDDSAARLAVLVGIHRVWGEGNVSLKKRADALSRWPYSPVAPELPWWARLVATAPRARSARQAVQHERSRSRRADVAAGG